MAKVHLWVNTRFGSRIACRPLRDWPAGWAAAPNARDGNVTCKRCLTASRIWLARH